MSDGPQVVHGIRDHYGLTWQSLPMASHPGVCFLPALPASLPVSFMWPFVPPAFRSIMVLFVTSSKSILS